MDYFFYESPVGRLTVLIEENVIRGIVFGHHVADGKYNDDPVLGLKIFDEFDAYFSGRSVDFTLKIRPDGTDFQKQVWRRLLNIPYGETITYSELAESIGHPSAVRAVGTACGSNPIPIIIPCHRVIGKDGSLTGYAGGIENKKFLLNLEKTFK
ncbi:MAG: methylated-DNA--[protein]-cysteine S-methyltransferase [Clostridia bacterium]|nr:methylated-DNA--[protein]-cysteine S-methyltransferase [Clostridia bacterium]